MYHQTVHWIPQLSWKKISRTEIRFSVRPVSGFCTSDGYIGTIPTHANCLWYVSSSIKISGWSGVRFFVRFPVFCHNWLYTNLHKAGYPRNYLFVNKTYGFKVHEIILRFVPDIQSIPLLFGLLLYFWRLSLKIECVSLYMFYSIHIKLLTQNILV